MRASTLHLLLVLLCTCMSLPLSSAVRKRKRCYVRLCFKCGLYVNSRGKRSLDGIDDMPAAERDDEGNEEVALWEGVKMPHGKRPENEKEMWPGTRHDASEILLHQYESDDMVQSPGNRHEVAMSRYRHHGRRSVAAHFERCLHLLRSRCCRVFTNTATYIGYRVRKN